MTDEEKVALTKGNSKAMIRANKEVFDYNNFPEKDLLFAERWYKAPKPFTGKGDTELTAAYYYYRIWNAAKWSRWEERFFTPRRGERGGGGGGGERGGEDDGGDGGDTC